MCAKYTRNSNGEDLHFLKILNDCLKQISSCFAHFYFYDKVLIINSS